MTKCSHSSPRKSVVPPSVAANEKYGMINTTEFKWNKTKCIRRLRHKIYGEKKVLSTKSHRNITNTKNNKVLECVFIYLLYLNDNRRNFKCNGNGKEHHNGIISTWTYFVPIVLNFGDEGVRCCWYGWDWIDSGVLHRYCVWAHSLCGSDIRTHPL